MTNNVKITHADRALLIDAISNARDEQDEETAKFDIYRAQRALERLYAVDEMVAWAQSEKDHSPPRRNLGGLLFGNREQNND